MNRKKINQKSKGEKKYSKKELILRAIRNNDVQKLSSLYTTEDDDNLLTNTAAQCGHLACLKFLHEKGCSWSKSTCMWAAINGHIDCLKYAHENECPWDERTCKVAGEKQYVCLKYAHEHGCPWNEETCKEAAYQGDLKCLRYALHNECPCDSLTTYWATMESQLDCLKYAHENGCPLPDHFSINYICPDYEDSSLDFKFCIEYLYNHGVEIIIDLYDEDTEYDTNLLSLEDTVYDKIDRFHHAIKTIEKYVIRKRALNRTEKIKRELMEKTWHPSRFEKMVFDSSRNRRIS